MSEKKKEKKNKGKRKEGKRGERETEALVSQKVHRYLGKVKDEAKSSYRLCEL